MGIKSFIYLDEYKMYSISSQIFAGLTEYIIDYSVREEGETEEQKGPIGSGRILADIISQEAGVEEKKFLHDYSYTLFENKLLSDGKVSVIDSSNIDSSLPKVDDFNFIKVTGSLVFNDIEIINSTLANFNQIGEAITYVTNYSEFASRKADFEEAMKKVKDRNKKATLKKKMEKELDLVSLAREQGLHQDEEYLNKLAYLLNYGFKDQFEVQISLPFGSGEEKIFSANLNRQYIKENESLLIRKYARYTEKKFAIFGMMTQSQDQSNENENENENDREYTSIKEALLEMVSKLSDIETSFTGRLGNEIVIDPIAVYREL